MRGGGGGAGGTPRGKESPGAGESRGGREIKTALRPIRLR